jgi:DNA-binding winged helix-turn-helix (wHTH) protein/TolB-like protein
LSPAVPNLSRVRFGPFELDPATGRLFKSGIPLKLQPQPFRVLLLLASRPGEVVSREEIQRHLWGESTFVDFEHGINFSINQIRAALCDNADKPRYIETLPRIGYRFVAAMEQADLKAEPKDDKQDIPVEPGLADAALEAEGRESGGERRNHRPLMWVATAAGVILLLVLAKFAPSPEKASARSTTMAILPFQNSTEDKQLDFLRVALSDEVATALSYTSSVSIRPSAISSKYIGREVDLQRAGQEMRVANIVTGHYLKEGDQLRVIVEVVDVENNRVIWRDAVASATPDMIGMREAINNRIRLGLLPALGITPGSDTMTHPHNEMAYDAYLRTISLSHDPVVNREAIALLESAVTADPDFAPAWEALGMRYNYEVAYANGGREMTQRSDAAFSRALALDPNRVVAAGQLITSWVERRESNKAYAFALKLAGAHPDSAQAHFVLSYIYRYAGKLDLSGRECDTAIALDPGNYSLRSCAWTFMELGKTERARDFLRLDAGSDWAAYGMATALIDEGKLDEAREVVRKISVNPHHFRDLLGACLKLQPVSDLDRFAREAQRNLGTAIDPEAWYYQGAILAFCGKPQEATRLLAGAIAANYCALTALQTDPLLKKLRGTNSHTELLSLAAKCQERFVAESN